MYESLLWNAVRLVRFRGSDGPPSLTDALALLAFTCGAAPGSERLDAAVRAGLAEERNAASPSAPTAVADATTWVLPAAACAVVSTRAAADPAAAMDDGLRDIAGALLVIRAPAGSTPSTEPPGEGLLLGHALAAGWLATQLWSAGVVGVPETFDRTLAAVVGTP
ncbi:MAG TPA: hypothetical protein VFT68_04445 [Lapillicoccus sp.]|nr:hypothetical protein [Lapillicoccus sp.]